VLSHPVVLVLLLALIALFGFGFWSAWRARRVDFIHQLALGVGTADFAVAVADDVAAQLAPPR